MTWIKTISRDEADADLRKILDDLRTGYPAEYKQPVHRTDDGTPRIVAAHTLIPQAMHHALSTFASLMSPELPLSRAQHEMIATRVSALNSCSFCAISHAEFLRRVTLDEKLAQSIREDYEHAPISETDRVMLDFASKVTTGAYRVTREDHERLAAHGFGDQARLQITLITAFFNYINRVADALGCGQND